MAENNETQQAHSDLNTGSASGNQQNNKAVNDTEVKKESQLSSIARKVGYALLFLIVGMLIVTLALYLPARSDLTDSQNELERLSNIESQYNELQNDYSSLLIREQVYKLIGDSALLESALLQEDRTRISQQVRYMEEDLSQLEIPDFPEVKERLESTFSEIQQASTSDMETTQEELQVLISDLLLLVDNLE